MFSVLEKRLRTLAEAQSRIDPPMLPNVTSPVQSPSKGESPKKFGGHSNYVSAIPNKIVATTFVILID